MAKELKFFSGNCHIDAKQVKVYVAAYTKKAAAEMITSVSSGVTTPAYITGWFSTAWGTPMDHIKAKVTEPCLYIQHGWDMDTLKKLI